MPSSSLKLPQIPPDILEPIRILLELFLAHWMYLLWIVGSGAILWSDWKIFQRKYPAVDWPAFVRGNSLRFRVHLRELKEYNPRFLISYILLSPDRRTLLIGKGSFLFVFLAVIGVSTLLLAVEPEWAGRLLKGNRGQFATAIVSLVSAGLVGVVFLLERGESDIYQGSGLEDRFAEIGLFPLIYSLIGATVALLYFALIKPGSPWIDALTLIFACLSLLVLIILFIRIVKVLMVNSLSSYFFNQTRRSAVREATREHRHSLATEVLKSHIPDGVTYTDYLPFIDFMADESKVSGNHLHVDHNHLSDVDIPAFEKTSGL